MGRGECWDWEPSFEPSQRVCHDIAVHGTPSSHLLPGALPPENGEAEGHWASLMPEPACLRIRPVDSLHPALFPSGTEADRAELAPIGVFASLCDPELRRSGESRQRCPSAVVSGQSDVEREDGAYASGRRSVDRGRSSVRGR